MIGTPSRLRPRDEFRDRVEALDLVRSDIGVGICGWEGGKNFAAGAGNVGGRVGVAVVREPVL
jgi:hypothetical protein